MSFKLEMIKTLDLLKKFNVDRRQVEKELNLSERYLDQSIAKGGNKKLLSSLKQLLERYKLQNPSIDISQIDEISQYKYHKEEGENNNIDINTQTLFRLANANEMLAFSNKELTEMLKQDRATANDQQQISPALRAILSGIQEVVLRLAKGERFGSVNEAAALLYKDSLGQVQRGSAKDIQKG